VQFIYIIRGCENICIQILFLQITAKKLYKVSVSRKNSKVSVLVSVSSRTQNQKSRSRTATARLQPCGMPLGASGCLKNEIGRYFTRVILIIIIIMFYYVIMAAKQNNTVEYTHTHTHIQMHPLKSKKGTKLKNEHSFGSQCSSSNVHPQQYCCE